MQTRFSFVIPTRGSNPKIRETLQSIAELTGDPAEVEIVIVLDGKQRKPEGVEWSDGVNMRVTLLEEEPAGPASARNRGAAKAKGEWFVFLDDDCRLHPDFLTRLGDALSDVTTAAGGTPQVPDTAPLWSHATHLVVEAFTASQRSESNGVQFLPSQNLAVHRNRWLSSGGFDESFRTAAGEDREFCLRWIEQGGRLVRVAGATYIHDHALTFISFLKKHRDYGVAAARFGTTRERSPGRFVRAAFSSLTAVRPRRRAVLLGLAVLLSQIATIWGALFIGNTEGSVRCAGHRESA